MHDALPLIENAEAVTVLAIDEQLTEHRHGLSSTADICAHLARHGVPAVGAHAATDDEDASAVMLSMASKQGADLIVIGAYGHSRLREIILGGMTRDLLKHMTVPVLLSH